MSSRVRRPVWGVAAGAHPVEPAPVKKALPFFLDGGSGGDACQGVVKR